MPSPDIRTLAYRLWRLRRLIAVSALLPLPGLLFAELWGVGLTFGGGGGILWLFWIAASIALAVRFPNGWVDQLALGLAVLAIILVSPVARHLGVGPVGGLLLGPLLLATGWVWLNAVLPPMLDGVAMGTRTQRFVARVRMPAKDLRDTLFLRPGARCGLHACGPADADGIFEVRALGHPTLDDGLAPAEGETGFFARVVERDETTQTTRFMLDRKKGSTGTTLQQITPARTGALYVSEELHDDLSAFAVLGFWLNDVEADRFTATLDFARGLAPRALKHAPRDSLLTWLGRRVAERMAGGAGDAA